MEDVQDQVQRIENKVQLLLKAYQTSQKEVQRLQKENMRLSTQVRSQNEEKQSLLQKINAVSLNTSGMSEHEKKDLEKRINVYLKDIDKCLALLHS